NLGILFMNLAFLLIVANILVYIFTPFNNAELLTTDRELIAIAAAAIIGLSKPKVAIGLAAEL
ncbi:MAG: hypothetical protein OEZ52_13125, partial [Candidatus Aminicenantes bacterium]|nr:hypothetical protein [Candidatus Aminicenantes bacterium]